MGTSNKSILRAGGAGGGEYRMRGLVWRRPARRVIPMGFGASVVLAQALQNTFTGWAGFPSSFRLRPQAPAPVALPFWGSIIDDVWGVAGKSTRDLVAAWFASYDVTVAEQNVLLRSLDFGMCLFSPPDIRQQGKNGI